MIREMLNGLLSRSPMLRFNARWLADTLTRDIPWQFEKKPLLRKASLLAPEITTLDVSKRDGILIFHDKGNTLSSGVMPMNLKCSTRSWCSSGSTASEAIGRSSATSVRTSGCIPFM